MNTKKISYDLKHAVLVTLKYMIEQLDFSQNYNKAGAFNLESPIGSLWPICENLYKRAERCSRKEDLKEHSQLLLLTILKVSPKEFF